MDSSRLFPDQGHPTRAEQNPKRTQLTMDWKLTEQACADCHVNPNRRKRAEKRGRQLQWPTNDEYWNLDHPEKSLMLLAPLAKEAGGLGLCTERPGIDASAPVFHTKDDPRYRRLLSDVRASAETFEQITTFERPGFVPSPNYIREMKRAGALRQDWQPGDPIDLFEVDRRYLQKWWPKARLQAHAR
jgi:hypothetical protein